MTSKILLGGGCVLTLGAKTGNFARADVLIEDGVIAEVGPGIRARDAQLVDANDTIVMPGFVDTHRHTWRSLFRNLGDGGANGRNAVPPASSGDRYGPDEIYAATLIGLLGAVEAGITTLVDWFDPHLEAGSAEAALQAHADSGLRTVFVPAPRREAPDQAAPVPTREVVTRLTAASGGSTGIAFGSVVSGSTDLDRLAGQWAVARDLGLRIHAHAEPNPPVAGLAGRGILGDDVTLVHCSHLQDADILAIASSGAAVSIAPASEMAGGSGPPPIQQLIGRNIRPGLAVDDQRLSPGDLFAQMRTTISVQHATVFDLKLAGKAGLPRLMSTRDVIKLATIDGARAVGLARVTGSLEPGKQADIVVFRTDRPNVFPINDPIGAVVWGMDTSNVDWVFVGGRALMREGVLQADVERARGLAVAARERVDAGSGLPTGASTGGSR